MQLQLAFVIIVLVYVMLVAAGNIVCVSDRCCIVQSSKLINIIVTTKSAAVSYKQMFIHFE